MVKMSEFSINKVAVREYVKKKRKQKGYTQVQLAEMMGLQNKSISCIETGRAFPKSENLLQFAEILDLSLDEFVFGCTKYNNSICIGEINELLMTLPAEDKNIIIKTLKTLYESLHEKNSSSKVKK